MSILDDIETYYGKVLNLAGIEFQIDGQGYVWTKECGSLGHLSECFEIGTNIHHLFEACADIDLDGYGKPQRIF